MIKLARILLVIAALTAFVMATLPQPPQLPVLTSDKVEHMLAFSVLAGLSAIAFPRTAAGVILIWLAAFGGTIEIVQAIPILHRDCELSDWIADIFASTVVLVLVELWFRVYLKRRRKELLGR